MADREKVAVVTIGLIAMDLTAAISNYQASNTAARVQTSVMRKALDAQQQAGASALRLLQSATNGAGAAGRGASAGDALVAQATGLGSSVDTYA